MTNKDYKEIVWNVFRQINARPNHIVYMRTFRFGVMRNMNHVEQEAFINSINDMINQGLVTYEEGQGFDLLRLTEKGYDELYFCRPDYQIAECLMDKFRKNDYKVGEIIPMRNINMQFIPSLNPKEQDRFEVIANKLIDAGYILYEDGRTKAISGLVLCDNGYDYIYKGNLDNIKTIFNE